MNLHDTYRTKESSVTATKTEQKLEQHIEQTAKQYSEYKRIMDIPGIGLITASALIAQVGDAKHFTSSRGFAA